MPELLIASESQQARLKEFAAGLKQLCQIHKVDIEPAFDGSLNIVLTDDSRPERIKLAWPAMAEVDTEGGCEFLAYDESALPTLLAAGIVGKVEQNAR